MKRRIVLLSLAALLVIGAVGAGAYKLGESQAKTAQPGEAQAGSTAAPGEKNMYNGDELTLVEMYDSLQGASGDDFDMRLLIYMMSITNNQTGMLRQVESKAQRQELKDLAKIQIEQNDKVITLMNKWQGDWGFTDH